MKWNVKEKVYVSFSLPHLFELLLLLLQLLNNIITRRRRGEKEKNQNSACVFVDFKREKERNLKIFSTKISQFTQ
jgi:hypothetical protein